MDEVIYNTVAVVCIAHLVTQLVKRETETVTTLRLRGTDLVRRGTPRRSPS